MTLGQESLALMTDRDTYFAGDLVWLSAYYFSEEEFSKILLVELVEGGAVYAQAKFHIQDGRASGALRIPEGAPSKNYQLRAYTNWQRNLPPEYYYTLELSIVNPASPLPNPLYTCQNENEKKAKTQGAAIQLEGLKDQYAPREKVSITLTAPAFLGGVTIAVVKKGTSGERRPIHLIDPPAEMEVWDMQPDQLPDIRDVSLSGTLTDSASGRPIAGELVYVSIVDKNRQQLHLYRTGENGVFVFPLNQLSGQQKVFISSRPREGVRHKILVNADFSDRYAAFSCRATAPDSTLRALWEEMYVNAQLQRKYTQFETDSASLPRPIPSYFGEPAVSVALRDFIPLPTMEEVFTEIVPFVSVRKVKKRYSLWVLNEAQTQYDQEPLVLIDNLPVFDLDALMQINPALVERIDVINTPYMLGSHRVGSVIFVKTGTPDFAGMKFPESTVFLNYKMREAPLQFPEVRYDDPAIAAGRTPDFRTVLYWNPRFHIGASPGEITFYTSDHESEYVVLVRGIDAEGKYFFWEEAFRVGRGRAF
jgi:hypothetical protein